MIKRIVQTLFLSLFAGFLTALFLEHWTWLEMRVNTSLIIPVVGGVGLITAFFLKKDLERKTFFLLEIIFFISFIIIYRDFSAFAVIPAIMLKESFFIGTFPLSHLNYFIIGLLIMGNAMWLLPEKNR